MNDVVKDIHLDGNCLYMTFVVKIDKNRRERLRKCKKLVTVSISLVFQASDIFD